MSSPDGLPLAVLARHWVNYESEESVSAPPADKKEEMLLMSPSHRLFPYACI